MLQRIVELLRNRHQSETEIYELVADELQSRIVDRALWTRAFEKSGGEKTKAEALYIKYRVRQLKANTAKGRQCASFGGGVANSSADFDGWLRKTAYRTKYGVSDNDLNRAIAEGLIRSRREKGKVWVEDRSF